MKLNIDLHHAVPCAFVCAINSVWNALFLRVTYSIHSFRHASGRTLCKKFLPSSPGWIKYLY